jgi:hypothetical protein
LCGFIRDTPSGSVNMDRKRTCASTMPCK